MTGDVVLATSPFLFAHRGQDERLVAGDVRGGSRFRLSTVRAAEIVTAFLEPRSVGSAVEQGFELDELRQARDAGILISEEERESVDLWERHGWSRPAHLILSQMDIPYRESQDAMGDRGALTLERRAMIDGYRRAEDPPESGWLAGGEAIPLPQPTDCAPRLSALTRRRSVRGFSPAPPDAAQVASVLHAATSSLRAAAADRATGDPFRLLNSFYSWAHLYVVIQEVDGLPPGAFEYDWVDHRLLGAAGAASDADLLACIQGQRGVLGPGFVVFFVADLRRYAWLYRHSRAYIHLLIQVGELGQEVLMAATELGLAGWPSPAVHESRSAALLGLPSDDALDVVSLIKLGRPPAVPARPPGRRTAPGR